VVQGFCPLEMRIKAAVLVWGGFWQQKSLTEADQINFAPRVDFLTTRDKPAWCFASHTRHSLRLLK